MEIHASLSARDAQVCPKQHRFLPRLMHEPPQKGSSRPVLGSRRADFHIQFAFIVHASLHHLAERLETDKLGTII
jgi:hypothetical protein